MTRSSRLPHAPRTSRVGRRGLPRARFVLTAALAAVGLLATSCDNPACVFGGDCSAETSGSLGGGNPAFRPLDHAWLSEGAPAVTRALPSGLGAHTDTPIAVLFNESMAAQTVVSNIGLFEVGGFGQPVPILPASLVGDGRMLIVIPVDLGQGPLKADTTYELRWDEGAEVTDLTGAALALPGNLVITSFTTATTNPVAPSVMLTFPEDGEADQSATGEVVVVFDRPMQQNTFNAQSFVVTANGSAPTFNPPPQPVLLLGQGSFPTTDTRVWQYRSVDGSGDAVSLGESASVRVRLSPSGVGSTILSEAGAVLPETAIDFTTADFSAPTGAVFLSMPDDALGIQNLGGGSSPLDLAVTLPNAVGSDLIGIFLFGGSKNVNQDEALFRQVRISDVPYDTFSGIATLTEAELDIASSGSPVTARFAEGELTIALRTERNGVLSPVRLVDVDADTPGPQGPLLDVTRPVFDDFGATGSATSMFVSDQRDLAVVGRASEELRAVFVDAGALGDNGAPFTPMTMTPSVVGSSADGLFVAAPVLTGVLDPAVQPAAFTMTIYDMALNSATSAINGTFVQRGAGFGAPGGLGSALDVQVFDARTLAPIQGATVYLHEDAGGGIVFAGLVSVTDAGGLPVPALTFPAGEAIVTVAAAGYDLFTYHGVPSASLGIPLVRTTSLPGAVLGTVSSTATEFPNYDRHIGDSTTFPGEEAAGVVSGCSFNVSTLSNDCSYGPLSVRPGPVRAAGFVAVDVPNNAFNFTAQGFLRGYAAQLPLDAISPGGQSFFDLRVDQLLSDTNTPQEERAVDGPAAVLDASGLAGVDLNDLDGDPRVAVQALARGVSGSFLTGFGAALDPVGTPADTWAVLSAVPGVADPTDGKYAGDEFGQLVLDRIIDSDLFLRVELRDNAGNRAGRRPRFSALGGTVVPLEVPLVSSPGAGGNTLTEGFDVTFDNVLAGFPGTGLYRVTLTGPNGRDWVLYRRAAAGASRTVHVPDLLAASGSGLPDGTLDCTVEAFEWGGLAPTDFLFTDIEREFDRFSQGAPISFDKP